MLSQNIKNNIKKSISLMFILFIVIPSLTGCGGGSGDSKDDSHTKRLEKITIEEVSHNNILESNEALLGTTLTFKAIGYYDDESTSDITSSVQWVSSDTKFASFDKPPQLKTHQIGQTTIIAKATNISATWSLSILEPVAITVSPRLKPLGFDNDQIVYVPNGTSITLDCIVEWSDNSKRDGKNYVSWTLDNSIFAQSSPEKNRFKAIGEISDTTGLTANFDDLTSNGISLAISDAMLKEIIIRPATNSENTTQLSSALYGTSREFTAVGVYRDPRDDKVKNIDITKDVKWVSSAPDIFNNAEGNNIFTADSKVGKSKATISARMFDVESKPQELTITDASLDSVDIVGADNFNSLVNNVEFSLSAIGNYSTKSTTKGNIKADITSFVNWSSSNENVLKQTGHNTFMPIKESKNISVIAEINGKDYKVSRTFNVVAGKLKSITISEIHNYPNHPITNTIPYNKSRTYKAIGEYTIDKSNNTVSLDITDNVKWRLDQEADEEYFRLSGSTVLAVSHNQSSAAIFAIGDNRTKVTSNLIKLTNIDFNKTFTLGALEYSLSDLMTSKTTFYYHAENGFKWGIGTWQESDTSCKKSGKRLASNEELQTLQSTIGDVGNALGWPIGNGGLEYWTSDSTEVVNSHISKNMSIFGGSYVEEDWITNASICVPDIE
ncbi:adhesion domain-containing protein [Vibrio gigantis]|uniref:adhesion domain-containing protein n=1 Tax=Vibrio gigantis TaxID=296199 RepID=UPI0035A700BA